MRDMPVPAKELADIKKAIVAGFALSLESPNAILNNYIDSYMYKLPADYWDKYPARIDAVTAARRPARGEEVLGAGSAADRRRRRCQQGRAGAEEARRRADLRRRRKADQVIRNRGLAIRVIW